MSWKHLERALLLLLVETVCLVWEEHRSPILKVLVNNILLAQVPNGNIIWKWQQWDFILHHLIMFLVQKVWLQMGLIFFMSTKNCIWAWDLQKEKKLAWRKAHIVQLIGNITRGLRFGNMCLQSNTFFLYQLLLNPCLMKMKNNNKPKRTKDYEDEFIGSVYIHIAP